MVVAGETVADIAYQYGVTIDAIVALNDVGDVNLVLAGQVLRIPTDDP